RTLGSSGIVIPLANPEATASAVISMLKDEQRWRSAQRAGIQRVERYYTLSGMLNSYKDIYDQTVTK
ncbi:MAG: glycosyl transferase family 1, partial [Flavobacteriaceae bacterium]|nr:glycosyl transferase family 1 [Flavobacteriaceae bacterium]